MRAECIEEVQKALGRRITVQESQAIEDRVNRALKRLATRDPESFRRLGRSERMEQAAKLASDDLLREAQKRKQRVELQAQTHARNVGALQTARESGMPMFNALARMLRQTETYIKGVEQQYFSGLMDTWQSTSPKLFGMIEDARGALDLVREIFGEDTGNLSARAGAKAWREIAETMRARFNESGGDIRKRADWHLPQPHDSVKIRAVDGETWVRDVLPLLDRRQYVNPDGTFMSDVQVTDALMAIKTILDTQGLAGFEPEPDFRVRRMLARRHEEAREIHFKDAAGWLAYHAKYGRGNVLTALSNHVHALAREIGLIEHFGPNPEAAFRALHDTARVDAATYGGNDMIGPFLVSTKSMWATLSGFSDKVFNADQRAYQRFAEIAQGVRNVEVFGKLQGALLSSVTDIPTFFITAGFNRLPLLEATANLVRAFEPFGGIKPWANRAGLVAESVISDMNRWAENNVGHGWSGRLANATMKVSLLQGWTDAIKRAFSVTMMGSLGKLSRSAWGALDEADRARLAAKGVTETDWRVFQLATPENWRGSAMLTPEAIHAIPDIELKPLGDPARLRNQAISRLLGAIVDESEYAAVSPDLYSRSALLRGTQKGTVEGEILRSIALFKSFPFAMISRHWMRVLETERFGTLEGRSSRVAYAASVAFGTTVFGALAVQLKDMRDGKDPRDMSEPKFWAAAFTQGGGAGILGDFVYTGIGGTNRYDQSLWSNLLGPVASSVEDLAKLTIGNLGEAARGEDTHVGAEALRVARSHLPLVNLWYARSVIDHAFLQEVQESLSPGYLARMRQRANREWNQDFWWRPGETAPERAPDVGRAFGQ